MKSDRIHVLKIEPQYLDNLVSGDKKCEIRLNDRDYQKNDVLQLYDHSKQKRQYQYFKITHIHSGLGMDGNYVVLSVKQIKESEREEP